MSENEMLVKRLTRALRSAEDSAGTIPAKEAVKLRPADWHAVTKHAREAATALTAAEARIKMLSEALGNVAVLVKHADENFRSEDYGVAYPALAVAVETAHQALTGDTP